jgi:hypothetical protein
MSKDKYFCSFEIKIHSIERIGVTKDGYPLFMDIEIHFFCEDCTRKLLHPWGDEPCSIMKRGGDDFYCRIFRCREEIFFSMQGGPERIKTQIVYSEKESSMMDRVWEGVMKEENAHFSIVRPIGFECSYGIGSKEMFIYSEKMFHFGRIIRPDLIVVLSRRSFLKTTYQRSCESDIPKVINHGYEDV